MMLLVNGSTKTVERLAGEYPHHLGILLSPGGGPRAEWVRETSLKWAVDNGAFSGFNPGAFRSRLERIRPDKDCLWVACPDAVGQARKTLSLFAEWHPCLRQQGYPVALVAQDGLTTRSAIPWENLVCLFIGGTDGWKISTGSAALAMAAKSRGKLVHMGRVNSFKRMRAAYDMGCDSVDGGQFSFFGETYIERYVRWLKHQDCQTTMHA